MLTLTTTKETPNKSIFLPLPPGEGWGEGVNSMSDPLTLFLSHGERELIQHLPLTPIAVRAKQSGVTLVITLIVLVAMTLATISLMRSVDTSNIIAGNLAFQQAASHAADAGIEEAARVLLPLVVANHGLGCTGACEPGYISWHDPDHEPPHVSWKAYWDHVEASANGPITVADGYDVYYVVESMCDGVGQTGECLKAPPSMSGNCGGSDLGAGSQQCIATTRYYYRVTSRVTGPRNTVSYIQAMLAM